MGSSEPLNPKIRVFRDGDKIIKVIKKGGKDTNRERERERQKSNDYEQIFSN
jgi:hypothetical protein